MLKRYVVYGCGSPSVRMFDAIGGNLLPGSTDLTGLPYDTLLPMSEGERGTFTRMAAQGLAIRAFSHARYCIIEEATDV